MHRIRRGAVVAGAVLLSLSVVGGAVSQEYRPSRLPPGKQALEDRVATLRATALASPRTPVPHMLPPTETPGPAPTPRVGIASIQMSVFRPEAWIVNKWQGYLGGEYLTVDVGYLSRDPAQGFLGVVKQASANAPGTPTSVVSALRAPATGRELPPRPGGISTEEYLAPGKTGALRITAESNLRLTLTAADGSVLGFDLPSRRFVAPAG